MAFDAEKLFQIAKVTRRMNVARRRRPRRRNPFRRAVHRSAGERIAVALVLDRYDLLHRAWGTIAESVYRLGEEWTKVALRVQRDGWDEPAA